MRVERAKMCRATWEALKVHIIRERKRKHDEMEADAEEARQKLKREQLKKQHKSTLEETIAEISQLETRLQELKEEKHEMFLKLKKVLNEDETRRREQLLKDAQAHGAPPSLQPLLSYPPLSQQHSSSGRLTLHKQMSGGHPQMLQMGNKRPRSPSPTPPPSQPPPPQQPYRHEYLYKGQPLPAMSYASLAAAGHPHVSVSSSALREEKHHPVYLTPSRGYAMSSHPAMDSGRDKPEYYSPAHRPPGHMGLHAPPMLPVQQPQAGKSGGITSGYPVRSAGPGTYQPASVAPAPAPTHSQAASSRQPPPSHQPPRFY